MRATLSYLALSALALAGCSSATTMKQSQARAQSQPQPQDPVILTMTNGTSLRYESDVRINSTPVPGTPASLWPKLNATFTSMGLPITSRDNAKFVVGALNAQFSNRFGKDPLSRIVDCGQSQFGPRANTYRVQLSVVSQLVPSGSGTTLRTSVAAMAKDENSSSDAVQCGSTGNLEHDIAMALGGN